jgi:hypothetical protein
MKGKYICFLSLLLMVQNAAAQLSTNPWVTANDEEEVAKVYEKRNRRGYGSQENYTTEAATTVDRTHAYIQTEEEDNRSTLQKMKDALSGKNEPKTEEPLMANTAKNRKIAAQKKAQKEQAKAEAEAAEESKSSLLPNFGISDKVKSWKNKFHLPKMNTTGAIQKFERSTGVDFKAMAKKFK